MKNFSLKKIVEISKEAGFSESYLHKFSNKSKIVVKIRICTLRKICEVTKNHQRIYVKKLYLHSKAVESLKLEINMAKTRGTLMTDFPDSIESKNGIIVKRYLPIDINVAQIYRTGVVLTVEHNAEFFNALNNTIPYKIPEIKIQLKKMSREIERNFVKKHPFSKKPIKTLIIEE